MKKIFIRYSLGALILFSIAGCDEYIRTEVVKEIFVNKSTVNGFVGQEVQLIASPTDGTYQYQWTTEDPEIATVGNDGKVKLLAEGFTNIVVSAGDIKKKVEIYSVVRIALQDIILSDSEITMTPGGKKTINIQRVPDNANDIPNAVWSSENSAIATVNEKGEIVGVGEGVTNIRYTVGTIVKKVKVTVSYTMPFNGPHILKSGAGTEIKAADFDFGGVGYAFNDDAGNPVGNDNYRKGKGDTKSFAVEIEGDGNNLGYVSAGDWYQYTVEVAEPGTYQFDASLSANGNGAFHIEVENVTVIPTINVPTNGSWSSWRYFPAVAPQINLTAGKKRIKFVVEKSGFNLRAIRFRKM